MTITAAPNPYDLCDAFPMNESFAPIDSPLLTLEEAADYLRRSMDWMYHTGRNEIPVVKIGRRVMFEKRDLDAYIANCREVSGR
jgi:excisionase family DNA binding protein